MKILGSVFILLLKTSIVLACTCVNTANISDEQHSKYLKQFKAIFYGEVIEIGEVREVVRKYKNGFSLTDTVQPIKFKVLTAWKGVETAEITVETDALSSCKFVPNVGNEIMIYAYENKKSEIPFSVNYCSINKFDDEKMKREYGAGKTFEQEKKEIRTDANSENLLSTLWNKVISFFS